MGDGTRVSIVLDGRTVERLRAIRAAGLSVNVSNIARLALREELDGLERYLWFISQPSLKKPL
jgi:hypothetical protein